MNIRQIRRVTYLVVSISQSNSDDIPNEKVSISFPPFLKDTSYTITISRQQSLSRLLQVGMGSDQILPEVLLHSGSCLINHSFCHFIVSIIWLLSSMLNRKTSSHQMIARMKMLPLSFLLFKDTFQFSNIFRRQVFIFNHRGKHGLHGSTENTS